MKKFFVSFFIVVITLVGFSAFTIAPAAAQSIEGKWCGKVRGFRHTYTLTQSGQSVSGTLMAATSHHVSGKVVNGRFRGSAGSAMLDLKLENGQLNGTFALGGPTKATYRRC